MSTQKMNHFFHQILIEYLQCIGSVPGKTDTHLNKTLCLQKKKKKIEKFEHLKKTY